jgi:hypothetical protein
MQMLRWVSPLRHWWRLVFRRSIVEQELSEELQFFLDHQIAANLALGMSPEDARIIGWTFTR